MIHVKRSDERGQSSIDWLESYHSFSFADYYDEASVHFGPLRVLNDDYVAAANGFPMHPHRDMEIITYVVEGELEHRDNMGNREIIKKNEVQKMSAGKGIFHSEMNPSADKRVHLYQTWIIPDKRGLTPYYEMKRFSDGDKHNKLLLIGSNTGEEGSVFISQDVRMYVAQPGKGISIPYALQAGRGMYIHVIEGSISVNGMIAAAGDALMIEDEAALTITANENSELLLFDVIMDFTF